MLRDKNEAIQKSKSRVQSVLMQKYNVDSDLAYQMVNDSTYSDMLEEDIVFVGHFPHEKWALEILDEYSMTV
jgi:hypothetical protein